MVTNSPYLRNNSSGPNVSTWRKVLGWEVETEPTGMKPLTRAEWQSMGWSERNNYAEKLANYIETIRDAGDESVKEWRGSWSGGSWATAIIWARTEDEATFLAREGKYEDWDESTGDEFDFNDVEEV